MSWLDKTFALVEDVLVTILENGVEKPQRLKLNFIGATVADDAVNERTNITIAGASPSSSLPQSVGTAAAGSSSAYSRADHVHGHGNQAGDLLHAIATGSVAGFLSAADKTRLDVELQVGGGTTDVNDTASSGGTDGSGYAAADHEHFHGLQTDGTLHAAAVASGASGFLTGTDKAKLDGLGANNSVTNAVLNDVATATIKGRVTAGTGDPEDLTGTQATTLLDVASGALKGLMSAADKTTFDAATSAATNSALCKRDASAGCAFVAVSATTVALADSSLSAPGSGIKVGSARQLLVRTTEGMQHEASCQDSVAGGTSKRVYDRIARIDPSTTAAAQDVDLVLAADLPGGSANWVARARVDFGAYDTVTNDVAGGTRTATIKCAGGTVTVLTAAASQVVGTDDDPGSTGVTGATQFIRTASGKLQFRFTTGKTNNTRLFARLVDLTLVEH
jgi:hypothetical protein